jgi:hypothetical protein
MPSNNSDRLPFHRLSTPIFKMDLLRRLLFTEVSRCLCPSPLRAHSRERGCRHSRRETIIRNGPNQDSPIISPVNISRPMNRLKVRQHAAVVTNRQAMQNVLGGLLREQSNVTVHVTHHRTGRMGR